WTKSANTSRRIRRAPGTPSLPSRRAELIRTRRARILPRLAPLPAIGFGDTQRQPRRASPTPLPAIGFGETQPQPVAHPGPLTRNRIRWNTTATCTDPHPGTTPFHGPRLLPASALHTQRWKPRDVRLAHDLVHGVEYRLDVRLGPVVSVAAISRAMRRCSECTGCGVEPVKPTLTFQHFLHHVCSRATGDVLVQEEHLVRLLE